MCYLIWQAKEKGAVKVVVNRKQNLLIFLEKDTLNEPRTSSIMTWFRSQKAPEQFLTGREWMSRSFVPSTCLWRGWCPMGRLQRFLRISFGQDANHEARAVVLNLEWFPGLKWTLGLLGCAARLQEWALPTSSLVLTPGSASPPLGGRQAQIHQDPISGRQRAATSARAPQGPAITHMRTQLATQINRGSRGICSRRRNKIKP